jgi:hypothetical protein
MMLDSQNKARMRVRTGEEDVSRCRLGEQERSRRTDAA